MKPLSRALEDAGDIVCPGSNTVKSLHLPSGPGSDDREEFFLRDEISPVLQCQNPTSSAWSGETGTIVAVRLISMNERELGISTGTRIHSPRHPYFLPHTLPFIAEGIHITINRSEKEC